MRALLYVVPLAVGLVGLTAWVVASDLVLDLLDKADPVAGFAEALQEEVDAALARDAVWARDRVEFAQWDQEFKS